MNNIDKTEDTILEINNLQTSFFTSVGEVKAVRGISLTLKPEEVLGIVGESGCGKSVSMMSILKLLPKSGKIINGEVKYGGIDLVKASEKEMRNIRGKEISMIFQDPMTSLNPLLRISTQLTEHYRKHYKCSKEEAMEKALGILAKVGIPEPRERIRQYPHEFSGGMRQRVMIAMGLMCDPKVLIADEPTTALDVTIQAQILDLFKAIKKVEKSSIIFITHDLGVVADICDRVAVMYGGNIIEMGRDQDIFYNGKHPYTWGLLKSVPNPDLSHSQKQKLTPIEGYPPDLLSPPKGCAFAARCDFAMRVCMEEMPPYFEVSENHKVACFLAHPYAEKVKTLTKGVSI